MQIKVSDNVEHFCRKLLEDEGVWLVSGACFGLAECVLFGYGIESERLPVGLSRFSQHGDIHPVKPQSE